MKELYVDVASCCGGGRQRVEKAIRDAVEDAYSNSDTSLWAMYFPYYSKREKPYPGNEDFVARIAGALIQIARVHAPSGYRCAGTGY